MVLHSPAALKKSDQAYLALRSTESGPPHGPVEVEVFEFKGDKWTITAIAPSGNYSGYFRVDGSLQRPFALVAAPDMSYPCVHVEDGIVFVYGTSMDHQRISMMRSTDLINWSTPVVVLTAPAGMGFYNTSVAKHTMSGQYRMVAEMTDPAYPANYFVIHRFGATNPTNWALLTGVFKNDSYVNCPMIRYIGDVLYMTWMENAGTPTNVLHATFVARSFDHGATWERGYGADGQTIPLVPAAGEGNNNSDMTIFEFEGQTFILYGRGDQTAWLDCVTAVWPGTMKAYFEQFFSDVPVPVNLLPVMTAETSSGVTVTASDTLMPTTFLPWTAADRNPATFWHCNSSAAYPHWWRAAFSAPQTVSGYSIKCRANFTSQGPRQFYFQGWGGNDWVVLDYREYQTYQEGVAKIFVLATPATYSTFRLIIEANAASDENLAIAEIELLG